ncbi:MAG: hypothetical protein GY811_15960 [Myxococcales bacterium]|nr:hypothetical protein [Myxococcales bacterium]
MIRSIVCIGLLAVVLGGACDEPETRVNRYSLTFSVADDTGNPLSRIPIRIGQTEIGETDLSGALRADVNARDGDRYALSAPCPEGYEFHDAPKEVLFLDTQGLAGKVNASLEIHIVCKRQARVAAVLVHADGLVGMPILVDGVPWGETGPGGFAHLRLEGASNSPFEISLDTSGSPTLVPKNPRHEMQLGSEDGLFVFEPVFSEAEAKPKSKRRRRRKRPDAEKASRPRRPVKID